MPLLCAGCGRAVTGEIMASNPLGRMQLLLSSKQSPCVMTTGVQNDTSAIVTLSSSGLDRPSKLDGKVYASYGAR